ncbi:MAG: hypothetical protein ACK521_00415 [bacterium]
MFADLIHEQIKQQENRRARFDDITSTLIIRRGFINKNFVEYNSVNV